MGANAQTSVPAFTAGQVLTAAQVTQINTGIPVFASSTERDAAFGGTGEKTLAEGQMAYLEDTNATQYYDGSSWLASGGKILQVVSTAKTDAFSASVTLATFSAVTGLSVDITPSSTSSKILVLAYLNVRSGSGVAAVNLRRDSTAIFQSDASADNDSTTGRLVASGTGGQAATIVFLDSPASTSSLTYDVAVTADTSTTVYVNRSSTTGNAYDFRGASSITVMEVSA